MPGYWAAHSDRDWQDSVGMYDEPADDDRCAISVTARRELLCRAHELLERAEQHERWGVSAMDYVDQAAIALRQAGLHELADELDSDPWGMTAAAILKEIEAEARR